mmetsp:Transcript_61139/g.170689  ORF Transcript_61139/g.170689 Transcript_61139/m.170689 type:complete len:356 (+) Transcript_61139:1165-2232(+)
MQDTDRLTDGLDLAVAELGPGLPLDLLLRELPLDLLDVLLVVRHLLGQQVDAGLGVRLGEGLGAVLLLHLGERLLRRVELSVLLGHQHVECLLGLLLLAGGLLLVLPERFQKLGQDVLDLERAGLVAHLERRLPVELFPIILRDLAAEQPPQEDGVPGLEEPVAELRRPGQGRCLLSLHGLGVPVGRPEAEQHALLVARGGLREDLDGVLERTHAQLQLGGRVPVVGVFLLPRRLGGLEAGHEARDLLLQVRALAGQLDAARLQVGDVLLQGLQPRLGLLVRGRLDAHGGRGPALELLECRGLGVQIFLAQLLKVLEQLNHARHGAQAVEGVCASRRPRGGEPHGQEQGAGSRLH